MYVYVSILYTHVNTGSMSVAEGVIYTYSEVLLKENSGRRKCKYVVVRPGYMSSHEGIQAWYK